MSRTSLTKVSPHMPSLGMGELNYWTLVPWPQSYITLGVDTYIEPRGRTIGILSKQLGGVDRPTDGASRECVLVARIAVLPVIPHLIDRLHTVHVSPFLNETLDKTNRVVKEEDRIYAK